MSTHVGPNGIKFPDNDAFQTRPVLTVDNQSPTSDGDVQLDLTSINNRIQTIQNRINNLKG